MSGKAEHNTTQHLSSIPGADETYEKIVNDSTLGHGPGLLATVMGFQELMEPKDQLDDLKKRAQMLVDKYGPNVIDVMTPELRKALGYKEK